MIYRFEQEDFKNVYVLEDYYCTNPFCDCNHVTLSLCDREDDQNRFSFLLNFNKTHANLPNHPVLTEGQNAILEEFMQEVTDEMIVLFKQRYIEAKAYGENNPMSYLMLEPGRYVNYLEIFPRNQERLDFKIDEERYFAEDAYEMDPRNDNKNVQLAFYKFDPHEDSPPSLFHYTYYLNEKQREEEDAKLEEANRDLMEGFLRHTPNLSELMKKRYKEAKEIGQKLLDNAPKMDFKRHKVQRNETCPCGSGKKFKKCCGAKLN
ncbi:MAG: hypothetical protein GWM98_03400 [Nitrospinaceae bacterium]|nr:hypothetical protein [Nitrospinaceae bacterium]NIR53728.1 hypothetical protein [Nitrospinaceae bacterium]NIS84136.1 hypothetical protein [Nitrospinaceae bacterium]NIT80937.1 hypothetical protein [Nitrospinaceae bacterium]NIU43235.1 hypothetical protein [Nitrospinaceae bacterium]